MTAPPVAPDPIPEVPDPVPQRSDWDNFPERGDDMMTWFVPGMAAVNTMRTYFIAAMNWVVTKLNEITALANSATASEQASAANAAAAAASANAVLWVTGTNYPVPSSVVAGARVYSPANQMVYVDTVGGVSATDPASDVTGRWVSGMLPSVESINLPAVMPTIAMNALAGASNVSVQVTRAMEKYRINKLGYLVADPAGVLGVDHDPVSKAPRGWKIDPQTVYLAMRSTEMDNAAYWPADNITVTPASRLGTDGAMSMYRVQVNTTAGANYRRTSVVVSATTQYVTFKVAKGNSAASFNTFGAFNNSTGLGIGFFTLNFDTGVCSASAILPNAVDVGNGIWEVKFTLSGLTIGHAISFYCGSNGAGQTAGNYFYASHFNVADKPNASHHPTAGSNITRPADVLTVTGPDFTDNFNPVEGTFSTVVEMPVPTDASRALVQVDDGTTNNRIYVARTTAALFCSQVVDGGVASALLGVTAGGNFLFGAVSYKSSDWRVTVRGSTAATSAAINVPSATLTRMVIGGTTTTSSQIGGWLRALYYYPRAVTAGESRALVTHA